jgi:hypothetical protein
MLGGLAAVSIPIAIHLLNKFRVRTVDWGAMRFLRESLRKNERRVKIEDLILLLLRCLLVAILVLAFARPVLRGFTAGGAESGPVVAMVLLDNSASMAQSNGVTTRFEDGRKAILQWLDERESHSLVGLFLVSNRTDQVIPVPQPDFGLVRKVLQLTQPTSRGTDLAQGIRLAYQTLKTTSARSREIRIYTDDQTCAWSKLDDIRKLARDNPDIWLRPVVLGKQGENNAGIVALKPEGSVPAAKQPYRIQVEVGNYGAQPVQGMRVSLALDADPPLSETVLPPIAPGGTQAVNLIVSFPDAGPHIVTATIPSDAFAADNQRVLAVDVVRRMGVLLVEGGVAESTLDRDSFFIANALLPFPHEQALRSYMELKFATLEQVDTSALTGTEVVFLSNPGVISSARAQALADYVHGGGNLVIFPGARTDPAQWSHNAIWADLLPATLAAPRDVPDPNHPLAWQNADFEHPILSLWNDPAQGNLGSVKTTRYFPLTLKAGTEHAKPAVVVRYANGEPAAAEWLQGKGRVVLFSSPATPEWNNLPLHPAFVPLMQRLMGYLNRKNEAQQTLAPGELFIKEVPAEWAGRDFLVQRPGAGTTPQTGGQIAADGGRAFLRYSGTEALGAYRMFVGGELCAACAVQLDPAESDLRQLEHGQLEALARPPAAEKGVSSRRMVVTREFWTDLIWIGAAVALVESALAHFFSQSR